MVELVQLERRHADFDRRQTRVIVISVESPADAELTQKQFGNLLVLADEKHGLSDAAGLLHPHSAPDGGDTAAPTTILVDKQGIVRWLFRPDAVITRLSPDEVLAAIDSHFPSSR